VKRKKNSGRRKLQSAARRQPQSTSRKPRRQNPGGNLSPVWSAAAESCADPARARHFLELLSVTAAQTAIAAVGGEQARILAAVFSGSPAMSNLLVTHPDWLSVLEPERLNFPRRAQGVRQEAATLLQPLLAAQEFTGALAALREFKQREMLRIGARDLARLGDAPDITLEISNVADVCLAGVLDICRQQLIERFGKPWQQAPDGTWTPAQFCVLGMGKLGGQELNYSSDVDVLFVYSDEGQVFRELPKPGARPVMPNHQFFQRLSEGFIAEVSRVAPEGMLFRIDLRLRPEGDSGPLCRSVESYENYYAQWGQTWERMMLIKARRVAGDETVAGEFLEMTHPFRYPRAITEDVLREVGAMKDRIEAEILRADEMDRNVKLGRGGIREIEFIAQVKQVIHAGKMPFLQGGQTLPLLEKLAQYDLLPQADARVLAQAYCFLRDVEHRIQMEENLQSHTIPAARADRERLARLMGFPRLEDFEQTRVRHTNNVRSIFDRVLKSEPPPGTGDPYPRDFENDAAEWKEILVAHGFRDPDKALKTLREFVEGPGYIHLSPRTLELARGALRRLLAMCPERGETPPSTEADEERAATHVLSDPDRVVTRMDAFIAAYGARPVLFEMWNSNPMILELLVLLFDRSEHLAELAIRTPDLVDDLVTSGRLRQRKTSVETLGDLRHGLDDEDQHAWLRRYHQAELMRIGLRDILGLADFEQYLIELSALADACLQYALDVVMRRRRLKKPPFVIIGLGKLGGSEIDYGSDLDIVFVADSHEGHLSRLQPLALEVADLISTRTDAGLVFHTDTRLRPDGEKGLVVNTLEAYDNYYRRRAALWEIQTLTRTRPVAGDLRIGEKFQIMAARLTNFSGANGNKEGSKSTKRSPAPPAACYTPGWRKQIHEMRLRIEKERTPPGHGELAIKTGAGGLVDAEFVAQTLCLANGWQEANTLRALELARRAGALPDGDKLIVNYRHLRRVEGILRRWSFEGETVLPDDPAPYQRVSIRCGFPTPEAFRAALADWRRAIREVYLKVMGV